MHCLSLQESLHSTKITAYERSFFLCLLCLKTVMLQLAITQALSHQALLNHTCAVLHWPVVPQFTSGEAFYAPS